MATGISFIDLYISPWLGNIVLALLIFLIGKWLVDHLNKLLLRVLRKSKFDDTLVRFLGHLSYSFLLVAVALAAVDTLGVDISSLLALIGAAGLAVGLALKDSLSNFAAGVMIIVFRPFKVGDAITAAGQSGAVEEIGMFSTHLNTPDNQRIIVPNSAVISGTIVNSSTLPTRRIDLIITIGADDSIVTTRNVLSAVLSRETRILPEPAPTIGVERITATGVEVFARPWVRTADFLAVKSELQEQIKLKLGEAGIEIPLRPAPVFLQTPRA